MSIGSWLFYKFFTAGAEDANDPNYILHHVLPKNVTYINKNTVDMKPPPPEAMMYTAAAMLLKVKVPDSGTNTSNHRKQAKDKATASSS